MSDFEYKIQGELPCCILPIGNSFDLLGCNFTYLGHAIENKAPLILIRTKITARDENEAERLGYEKCKDAAYLLEICIRDHVYFDREKEICSISSGASALNQECDPLPRDALKKIGGSKIFLKISKSRDVLVQQESVKRSIHWYNSSHREAENKMDTFLKLWIAFEILSGKKCQALRAIRSDIIHLGKKPVGIEEKCIQLNQIVSKLISEQFIISTDNGIEYTNPDIVSLNKATRIEELSNNIFDISIPGELDCYWPINLKIDLDGCLFSGVNNLKNFWAKTEVNATNEDDAKLYGRQKCDDAADILEFLIGRRVILSPSNITIKRKGETSALGFCSTKMHALISGYITDKELQILENVRSVLDQETASDNESLRISIRWRARALRGSESEIDRFLRFWIALEVLVEGEGRSLVDKVALKLKCLYPNIEEQELKKIVGHIYGMRGDIVHRGMHHAQDLAQKLKQLECIYDDLLKDKLGIEPNYSLNKYFVEFEEL